MKRRNFIKIIIKIAILSWVVEIPGCRFSDDLDNRLDTAENIMEDRPDSALCILNSMDEFKLRGSRAKARYSLLKSMALDKNYIDITTFDELQPAIDYYLKNGNADERLRTLYYKGRIHRNAGDDDLAMQSYLSGLDNMDLVSDSLTLARLLVAQGTLYYKQYQLRNLIDNNIKAAEIYGLLNRLPQQLKSYFRALNGEVIIGDSIGADSLANICRTLINDCPSMKNWSLRPFLNYSLKFGNTDEIIYYLENVLNAGITDDIKMNIARAYSKIGNPEKGIQYLNKAKVAPDNILDSLSYWSIKTEILENMGNDKAALDAFRNYSRVLEIYHDRLFSNELLFSEKKHEMEIESLRKIHKRDNAIKWILAGVAVLICIIGFIYYRYRLN